MKAAPPPPLPSAPAALTVPNPFGGFIPGPRDLFQSPDGSDRYQQLRRPVNPGPPGIGGGGGGWGYPWPYYPDPTYMPSLDSVARRRQEFADVRGSLGIETIPGSAQVFVDGFYVGTADEFGLIGRPISIAAGSHRVELRAPGYETAAFSVMIEPNQILRYRGDMRATASTPPTAIAPSQPAAAKTFYVIPKCYAGDKPPKGPLPKGCDAKNLQTYK
jgi:hypothetical protein